MHVARTTAEMKCEDLAGLLATSAGMNERITARMPAVTLEKLLTVEMTPIASPRYHRIAVIAVSAAVTVITVLGIATVI
jgi:hypothetical protein